jgi:hypothetical protein
MPIASNLANDGPFGCRKRFRDDTRLYRDHHGYRGVIVDAAPSHDDLTGLSSIAMLGRHGERPLLLSSLMMHRLRREQAGPRIQKSASIRPTATTLTKFSMFPSDARALARRISSRGYP